MERRRFPREFKLEAVRLIKERGVSFAQASHDGFVVRGARCLARWVLCLADTTAQPAMKSSVPRFAPASLPAIGPTAPDECGAIFSPKGYRVDCIGSSD
jgi:transposase-like protein